MLAIETLFFPVLMLMGLTFLYSLVLRTVRNPNSAAIIYGLLFGAAVIVAMSLPIRISGGIIFDLRGLFTAVAVVFGGWIAGLVTLLIGIAYRLLLGGTGALAGVAALTIAFGVGLFWIRFLEGKIKPVILSDAFFGILVSLALVGTFVMPFELAYAIAIQIFGPVTLANVVGAIGIGFALRREKQYISDAEQLRFYASVDPLTKVLNRRGAAEEVKTLSGQSAGGQALFYFDIDHFKSINDRYGHAAGDMALAVVANRIEGCVREKVVFCRHGGDEFTLYMPEVGEAAVGNIADRFRRAISDAPVQFDGQSLDLSISIGAYWSSQPVSFEDMLVQADRQLLQAKARGRNQVSFSSDTHHKRGRDTGWAIPAEPAV